MSISRARWLMSWRFWEPRKVRDLRVPQLYSVKIRTFPSCLTFVPIYQHTQRNVLKVLRGHKIETCRKHLNSSWTWFWRDSYSSIFCKVKEGFYLKNEKNIYTNNKNFRDNALFVMALIVWRIKILKKSQNVERKWGVQIQVFGI